MYTRSQAFIYVKLAQLAQGKITLKDCWKSVGCNFNTIPELGKVFREFKLIYDKEEADRIESELLTQD
jgi:hypothetical protein